MKEQIVKGAIGLKQSQWDYLKEKAEKLQTSVSAIIRIAVEEHKTNSKGG